MPPPPRAGSGGAPMAKEPLKVVFDYEVEEDNPVEDKYRKLAHGQ